MSFIVHCLCDMVETQLIPKTKDLMTQKYVKSFVAALPCDAPMVK